jgi:hypothetical protein
MEKKIMKDKKSERDESIEVSIVGPVHNECKQGRIGHGTNPNVRIWEKKK